VFSSDSTGSNSKLHIPQGPGKKDRIIPCLVNYCHGVRLQIITAEAVPPGSAISVEHDDALHLGEVVHNTPQSHVWKTEICVEQVLHGLMDVMKARENLI
jgi:hypothetical protein